MVKQPSSTSRQNESHFWILNIPYSDCEGTVDFEFKISIKNSFCPIELYRLNRNGNYDIT